MSTNKKESGHAGGSFSNEVAKGNRNLATELVGLLLQNKKWWLTPIVLALLLLGMLVVIGGSSAAPFIYSLF